ncbi:hypothetical protein [Nostoc sp.]|uniref:hypothetical protein n=1 Tax=Nostoc sp. TaxID=1180 RepID=UPI002FFC57DA
MFNLLRTHFHLDNDSCLEPHTMFSMFSSLAVRITATLLLQVYHETIVIARFWGIEPLKSSNDYHYPRHRQSEYRCGGSTLEV